MCVIDSRNGVVFIHRGETNAHIEATFRIVRMMDIAMPPFDHDHWRVSRCRCCDDGKPCGPRRVSLAPSTFVDDEDFLLFDGLPVPASEFVQFFEDTGGYSVSYGGRFRGSEYVWEEY